MAIFNLDYINEALIKTSKKLKGITVDVDDKSTDKYLSKCIGLCNKHWDDILNEAAKRMYKHVEEVDFEGCPEKLRTVESIKRALVFKDVYYEDEGKDYNPICGNMSFCFDTNPSIDPYHYFSLYVYFAKDGKIIFSSSYDG